jgi:hypothetical protein
MEQLTVKNYSPAMSDDVRALASAFLLAQNDFSFTGLDGDNSFQKYKYAKIGAIYKSVKGALSKQNIIIWHFARPNDSGMEYLYTRLIHTLTGQFIEDCRVVESEKPGNQAKGAANTYMKKYAVLSLCAISAEDDDGQEEEKHINNKPDLLVQDEVTFLHTQLKLCKNGKKLYENILADNNIRSFSDLPFSRYEAIKSYIINHKE